MIILKVYLLIVRISAHIGDKSEPGVNSEVNSLFALILWSIVSSEWCETDFVCYDQLRVNIVKEIAKRKIRCESMV